ncbi:hypothetical protein AMATHDRAFT_210 [Amanita thiersii Skay4041]|uniref:Ino eighty subunit 1 n=1 Tax=Amanita thiersii Skay4041 TaxID=703135 RepID=A0A2A9NUK5_9AGAR|nr:hypothetical protein AMATHDRAFT_210 [Amanita thiersii Skay4041]
MSSRKQSPAPRRILPIKRADGEPLTRLDIQYDLLSFIFTDDSNVFTDPWRNSQLVAFRDLYIDAILNSPKATKALKDKMLASPQFATSFAMLSLLVNVGRINTTMSFFPEMKTAIRTYHPIPALQKTEGNLQDAPRIKHILKAVLLKDDGGVLPVSPQDLISRLNEGKRPSTSVMNLLFILASHSSAAIQQYFKPTEEFSFQLDFLDLFLRTDVSSASRARAFLWLCWNYLEMHDGMPGVENPFSTSENRVPTFVQLSKEEVFRENVDPVEEKAIAERLIASRSQIVRNNSIKDTQKDSARSFDDQDLPTSITDDRSKLERSDINTTRSRATQAAKERKAAADRLRREKMKERAREQLPDDRSDSEYASENLVDRRVESQMEFGDYHRHVQQSQHVPTSASQQQQTNQRPVVDISTGQTYHHPRYSPYRHHSAADAGYPPNQLQRMHRALPPSMTMLQHAWHMIMTTDPLIDSDEELGDDDARIDYSQRIRILSRIRGKSPTPEQECHNPPSNTSRPSLPITGRAQ